MSNNEASIPYVVAINCSYCRITAVFQLNWKSNPNKMGNYAEALCPGCSGKLKFFFLVNENSPMSMHSGALFVYPGSKERRPLSGLESATPLSEPLKRSYNSALVAFNTGEWNSTAVMSRRLLGNCPDVANR